jgi:hypothetical protein
MPSCWRPRRSSRRHQEGVGYPLTPLFKIPPWCRMEWKEIEDMAEDDINGVVTHRGWRAVINGKTRYRIGYRDTKGFTVEFDSEPSTRKQSWEIIAETNDKRLGMFLKMAKAAEEHWAGEQEIFSRQEAIDILKKKK